MVQILVFAVLLATDVGSPTVTWHYNTEHPIVSSLATGDLVSSSPGSEVVGGNANGELYCLTSDGRSVWMFDTTGRCLHPAIANIDDEGNPEVLIYTLEPGGQGYIHCLSSNGYIRWTFNTGNVGYPGLTVANVDAIGHPEVLAGGLSSLYCLNYDGSLKWSYLAAIGHEVCSPAVANVDEEGAPEVIFASSNGRIYCLDSDGNLKWDKSLDVGLAAGTSVADVDLDGDAEIIVVSGFSGGNNVVHCLESDGALRWSKRIATGGATGLSMAAVDDINDDGRPEMVVFSNCYGSSRDSLYVLQDDGGSARVVWSVRATTADSGLSAPPPIICDLDGDRGKEVVWEGTNYLRIYDGLDGTIEYHDSDFESYPACLHPAVADVDGDGHADIVAVYKDTEIGVLTSDAWVECRDQFSCYTYHITNINDDLSVPRIAPNHWETHNSWLAQGFLPVELASISGGKFYDSNANGFWDAGEQGLADWLILLETGDGVLGCSEIGRLGESYGRAEVGPSRLAYAFPGAGTLSLLSVDSTRTDTSGHYGFLDLEPGMYTVAEVLPPPHPVWIPTTPVEYSVTVQPGQNVTGIDFGNVALGEIGARTIGYWKNHLERITPGMYAALDVLPAFVACGNPDSVLAILRAPWPDMAAKLRAQLLAMTLNVLSGIVPGDAIVYLGYDVLAAELLFGTPSPSFKAAQEVLDAVELAYDWGSWSRSEQEAVKDLLDRMNNDLLFVLSSPPEGDGPPSETFAGASMAGEYEVLPHACHLFQNLPNPFGSGGTTIQFSIINYQSPISLKIYDLAGRLVRTLVEGERRPGVHSVDWDGRAHDGTRVPDGIYFCQIVIGDRILSKKMAIVR